MVVREKPKGCDSVKGLTMLPFSKTPWKILEKTSLAIIYKNDVDLRRAE